MEEIDRNTEKNNPLVSIVVITYNSAKYVLETLESAKAQTYQNIELIVSDDCSTDNTVEICRNWIDENKDRFVRTELITVEKNTGVAANCNRGLYSAKGEWVKFIAGDDYLLESAITNNINQIIENDEIMLMFSDYWLLDDETGIKTETIKIDQYFFSLSEEDQYKYLRLKNNILIAPTAFISKKIFSKCGSFDETIPMLEDYCLWLIVTSNKVKIYYLNVKTVVYRFHDTNISVINSKKFRKSSYLCFRKYRSKELWKLNKIIWVKLFVRYFIYQFVDVKKIHFNKL